MTYGRRLERRVRAAILGGRPTWHCTRCRRYTMTRVGLALHVLACRETPDRSHR